MYDDVPFVVLLKNPQKIVDKHSRIEDTEESLRPVIIQKVAVSLFNGHFETSLKHDTTPHNDFLFCLKELKIAIESTPVSA